MFAKKKGLSMGKILSAALALYALFISNSAMAKNMDSLTANEKNIVRAAAFAAKGDQTGLKSALSAGLDSGVSAGVRCTKTGRTLRAWRSAFTTIQSSTKTW